MCNLTLKSFLVKANNSITQDLFRDEKSLIPQLYHQLREIASLSCVTNC